MYIVLGGAVRGGPVQHFYRAHYDVSIYLSANYNRAMIKFTCTPNFTQLHPRNGQLHLYVITRSALACSCSG